MGLILVVPMARSKNRRAPPDVAPRGDEHIDDLAELVDRPVHIPPAAGGLHIGLVDLPAISNTMSARPSSLGQQWREPLHPAIHGDVVDLDAPLGEQLLDVAVGEAEAQIPVHGNDNHIGWEPEASKLRPWNRSRARTARSYAASLAAPQRSQRTQQHPVDTRCGSGWAVPTCLVGWSEPDNQAEGGDSC
jgi:hypothetical protein